MSKTYSAFNVLRQGLWGHKGWARAWGSPEPQSRYDVIVIGGGGQGLATAYYLAKNHGVTNVALLATQARQDNPDLLLGRVMFARLALDAPDQLVSGFLRCSGFLVHLRSILAAMNQKSSVAQTPKSIRQVLTSDSLETFVIRVV